MRTNIVLDDILVKEAIRLSGLKTKKEVVALALQEFVNNKKRLNLLDLSGKIAFDKDYDYKKLREANDSC
jgi:Arc/MetJ family transcription regulator